MQPPSITANTDLVQRQKPSWLLVGQNGGGIVEDMIEEMVEAAMLVMVSKMILG